MYLFIIIFDGIEIDDPECTVKYTNCKSFENVFISVYTLYTKLNHCMDKEANM